MTSRADAQQAAQGRSGRLPCSLDHPDGRAEKERKRGQRERGRSSFAAEKATEKGTQLFRIEVKNNVEGSTVSKYDYGLDTLGRRTSAVHTGSAFSQNHMMLMQDPAQQDPEPGYNDRSELQHAARYLGTDPGNPGDLMGSDFHFAYHYDNIGNREDSNIDDAQNEMTYTANDVNQYDSTTYPTKSLRYDEDGNLTADNTYSYTWDAENRLIQVVTKRAGDPVNGDKRLEFVYDYMGRRVEKVYSTFNGTTWVEQSTQRFVYDGWNVVLILDDSNDTQRKYTWGLDMSQTIHGAGGIGGLLACVETQGTSSTADDKRYWYLYDANGNVGQVLDATDPMNMTIAARYEYGPYGNIIGPDDDGNGDWRDDAGPYAETNPFRFSTKWLDTELADEDVNGAIGETGLYYYGYRYYTPRLGRWLNRDPLEEEGGRNLYVFVHNQPMNMFDPDGHVVIGLNGLRSILDSSGGRTHIDEIGTKILNQVNGWRTQFQFGRDPAGYIPLEGGDGKHRDKLREEMRRYAKRRSSSGCPEGMIVFGYSDGAMVIHREFRKGYARASLKSPQDPNKTYRISYVAFIDMVRTTFYGLGIFPNGEDNKKLPLKDAELIRGGRVFCPGSA